MSLRGQMDTGGLKAITNPLSYDSRSGRPYISNRHPHGLSGSEIEPKGI